MILSKSLPVLPGKNRVYQLRGRLQSSATNRIMNNASPTLIDATSET